MNSGGAVEVVSGAGAKGTSRMELSGGKGLGPEGARRLAGLLREAPPPMLKVMDLRCLHPLLYISPPYMHTVHIYMHPADQPHYPTRNTNPLLPY